MCTQVKKKLQKRVVADERVKAIKGVEKRTCERKYKRENVITTEEALLKPAFFFSPSDKTPEGTLSHKIGSGAAQTGLLAHVSMRRF